MFFRFPAATRARGQGLPSVVRSSQRLQAQEMGIRTRDQRRPARHPLACHMQKGREAAYIWQAVPKEVTPCRTSREGQSGRTS